MEWNHSEMLRQIKHRNWNHFNVPKGQLEIPNFFRYSRGITVNITDSSSYVDNTLFYVSPDETDSFQCVKRAAYSKYEIFFTTDNIIETILCG